MEIIKSKTGDLTWNVLNQELRQTGKRRKTYFTVSCPHCAYEFVGQKVHVQERKMCPGCAGKPAALKTDDQGQCLTICEIGTVEFIRDYQEQHGVSERAAVRQFVETVKVHLSEDDPMGDSLTEESVRSTVRRQTGRKKNPDKLGQTAPAIKSYRVAADPEEVRKFLEKYLPGFCLIEKVEGDQKTGARI